MISGCMPVSDPHVLACVIGSMDLVRPLGLAGVRCAVVVAKDDVAAHSRFTRAVIPLADPAREPDVLLQRLVDFAASQPQPPVLFYGTDADLLFASRRRERLREVFRFVIAPEDLVEDLTDKSRFEVIARRLELPVPPSQRLLASTASPGDLGLRFPLILKPVAGKPGGWRALAGGAKAMRADSVEQLRRLWPRLQDENLEVMVQELVPGPESRVESYHVYCGTGGEVVAEFTGRKLRTRPAEYGETTALEITDAPDLAALGRDVVTRIGLTGIAKLDFKRDAAGRLHLLEINPRSNLWHPAGARAGVNRPALVHGDLTGRPRPPVGTPRAGVRWVYHVHDAPAARRAGVPLHRWIPWALSAEAKSVVALDDPRPMLSGALMRLGSAVRVGPRARR